MPEENWIPSTFQNQEAEFVACMFITCYGTIPVGLADEDFTHSECATIFRVASRLQAEKTPITLASLQVNPKLLESFEERNYASVQPEDVVRLLKECTYRRALVKALWGSEGVVQAEAWQKAERMSTPALVKLASDKAKDFEEAAKPYSSLVESYVPSLKPKAIEWATLQTEDDILKQQGSTIEYLVDEIIPKHRVTMIYGPEKQGKSIVALDLIKHVANGKQWLNRRTVKTPCLYIDLEDGILGSYIGWVQRVGPEKIRFITLRTENGVPDLNDPTLLAMCAEKQPLIVLDSLHKFFARNKESNGTAWQSDVYEVVLEKIRQLCIAGATVIVIHHSTKSDKEKYRDSSAIGANVDFIFNLTGDKPENGITRMHLKGEASRGAYPPTIHILAFPHIIDCGHLCVDAGLEKEESASWQVANEVRQNGPADSATALWKRVGGRKADKLAAIKAAIEEGWLIESDSGRIDAGEMPPVPAHNPNQVASAGTSSGTDETDQPF